MRTSLKAFFAIAIVAMLAGYSQSSAQCPPRPPGYWLGTQCRGGITVYINGMPCLVEICYCQHLGNGTLADPDEYSILTVRGQIPGCLPPNPDPIVMETLTRAVVNAQTGAEEDHEPFCAGEQRYMISSHAVCAKNIGAGNNVIWQGCPGGECSITYLVCMESGINKEISRTQNGQCVDIGGCMNICQ